MRAVLLGTGSPPPNPKRRGPATLLTLGQERFLVDAGSGVGAQLVRAGIRPYDWPRVLITHHHSDHTIDLGHLLITPPADREAPRLPRLGRRGAPRPHARARAAPGQRDGDR